MLILEAHAKDTVRTGFRYSIRRHGNEPVATTDVVEAIRILTDRGVERAADVVELARKQGRVEIQNLR
jgi:hypothetical protein